LVQEKLRAGLITRDQLKTDGMKNVITRSVGYDLNLKVDVFSFETQPGDGFLLCSDGLSGPLSEEEILSVLEATIKSNITLEQATKRLIDAANTNGGDDNITAVLVRCMER
jgi:serine/threonine protein phosphatase PrpC